MSPAVCSLTQRSEPEDGSCLSLPLLLEETSLRPCFCLCSAWVAFGGLAVHVGHGYGSGRAKWAWRFVGVESLGPPAHI